MAMQLNNIDSDDITDVLPKIERSFKIRFLKNELADVKTFGELCRIVIQKVSLPHVDDCTSQQAFYKLRNAINKGANIDKDWIRPEMELSGIFPSGTRRQMMADTEKEMGFAINALVPVPWIGNGLGLVFLASLIALFFAWKFALVGIALSVVGGVLSKSYANTLAVPTVGALAMQISRENYMLSRRNPTTVNRAEVVKKVRELFSKQLDLNEEVLTEDAVF